jgi:hypothetical protein
MKLEYAALIVMALALILVVTYLVGERTWGNVKASRFKTLAFWFYRRINRLKIFRQTDFRKDLMLNLIAIGPEITSTNPNFTAAQATLKKRTIYELVDIYDDNHGKRYLKIKTPRYGILIFEIMEYMRVALDKEFKEMVLSQAPEGATKVMTQDLETKPILRLVKNDK